MIWRLNKILNLELQFSAQKNVMSPLTSAVPIVNPFSLAHFLLHPFISIIPSKYIFLIVSRSHTVSVPLSDIHVLVLFCLWNSRWQLKVLAHIKYLWRYTFMVQSRLAHSIPFYWKAALERVFWERWLQWNFRSGGKF